MVPVLGTGLDGRGCLESAESVESCGKISLLARVAHKNGREQNKYKNNLVVLLDEARNADMCLRLSPPSRADLCRASQRQQPRTTGRSRCRQLRRTCRIHCSSPQTYIHLTRLPSGGAKCR